MPFKKGEIANPSGRPVGGRQKLSEKFLDDVLEDWKTNGAATLHLARAESPMEYVKLVASMLPKEATLNVNETLTIKSAAIHALDGWLEGITGERLQGESSDIVQDGSLLPAPICVEQT